MENDRERLGRKMRPKAYSGMIPIPERLICEADRRARRYRINLEYDDIGEELLMLRRKAYELYGAGALWNVAGHATASGMRSVADSLRMYGSLEAARLAAEILDRVDRPAGNSA